MMNNDIRELTKYGGRQFYIYTHARPDGSVFYVGKGVGDRARDFSQRKEYHKNIVAKYGRKNILISVYPTHDEEHAYAVERQLILAMRKAGLDLCNHDNGGNGRIGVRIGPNHREKISAALMGHSVSDEARERMRAKRLGVPLTETTKAKLSALDWSVQVEAMRVANRGMPRSEETKAKISKANKGRQMTPEQRAKNGDRKRGVKQDPAIVAKRAAGIRAAWARRKAQAVQP